MEPWKDPLTFFQYEPGRETDKQALYIGLRERSFHAKIFASSEEFKTNIPGASSQVKFFLQIY